MFWFQIPSSEMMSYMKIDIYVLLHKNLYVNVYGSSIHHCQTLEIAQLSVTVGEWISRLWYIHAVGYYLALKRTNCWYSNMDEPRRHYAEWKKLISKGHILSDSIYMTFLKRQKHSNGEQMSCCQGFGRVMERLDWEEVESRNSAGG